MRVCVRGRRGEREKRDREGEGWDSAGYSARRGDREKRKRREREERERKRERERERERKRKRERERSRRERVDYASCGRASMSRSAAPAGGAGGAAGRFGLLASGGSRNSRLLPLITPFRSKIFVYLNRSPPHRACSAADGSPLSLSLCLSLCLCLCLSLCLCLCLSFSLSPSQPPGAGQSRGDTRAARDSPIRRQYVPESPKENKEAVAARDSDESGAIADARPAPPRPSKRLRCGPPASPGPSLPSPSLPGPCDASTRLFRPRSPVTATRRDSESKPRLRLRPGTRLGMVRSEHGT